MRIAVDAMGGDFAPQAIVAGAAQALADFSQITQLFLVGQPERIQTELRNVGCNDLRVKVVPAHDVLEMHEQPVLGLRRKRDTSVGRAVDLVKSGQADAVLSAGNTGGAVAATMIKLRLLEGVQRAGIATLFPSRRNIFILIDSGANTDARPIHLLQYAVMGSVYAHQVLGYENPRVGLMSIGEEDAKGNELTKEVFKLLEKTHLNFVGNVEGRDLFEGAVEVVVTDGFVGNIILKTCESVGGTVFHWLRDELQRTPTRKFGAWLARGAFRTLHRRMDYEEYGGAPLLGVRGICIIAHGASSPKAIRNAIRVAVESMQHQTNLRILQEIQKVNEEIEPTLFTEPALHDSR